jgi:hypothetical protein
MGSMRRGRLSVACVVVGLAAACGASNQYFISEDVAEDDDAWVVTSEPGAIAPDAGPAADASAIPAAEGPPGETEPARDASLADASLADASLADAGVDAATPPDASASSPTPSVAANPPEEPDGGPSSDEAAAPRSEPAPSEGWGTAEAPPKLAEPRVRWTEGLHEEPHASEPSTEKRRGLDTRHYFLSLALIHGQVFGDDFEGTTALVAPGAAVLLPKMGADTGVLASVGFGARTPGVGGYAFAFEYSQSWASTTFAGATLGAAKLVEFSIPTRLFLPGHRSVVPYLETAFGLDFLWVEGAWESNIAGHSFDFGAGVAFFVTDTFGIDVGLGYRAVFINSVNERAVADSVAAGRWLLRVGPLLNL